MMASNPNEDAQLLELAEYYIKGREFRVELHEVGDHYEIDIRGLYECLGLEPPEMRIPGEGEKDSGANVKSVPG